MSTYFLHDLLPLPFLMSSFYPQGSSKGESSLTNKAISLNIRNMLGTESALKRVLQRKRPFDILSWVHCCPLLPPTGKAFQCPALDT